MASNSSSLWVDKYRPNSISKLTLHPEISNKLESLAKCDEIPHLLFYGPAGSGKKTRVNALLREIYGAGVEKVKVEHRNFKTPTGKVIEMTTLGSNYHVECNASDAGGNADRFVVQEVIKEIASHTNLQSSLGGPGARSFKILVLTEVDRLSRQAQAALRRTMEKYSAQCRLVLVCTSPSKIIEPLRSRCLGIRIPAPSPEVIAAALVQTARKEGITLAPELAMRLSQHSQRNLRRGLLMLEAVRVQAGPSATQLMPDCVPVLPDWELYIVKLSREIMNEQSPSKLLQARDMFYELLTNCIPAEVILITLTNELLKSLDDTLKHEVVYWSAYYEHRICQGSKEIFHLEAFVAKFMTVYKRWLIALFG